MKLTKPLAFFDLETTGVDTAKDRIVSIAVVKYFPQTPGELIVPPLESYTLVNPEMVIPDEAIEVHKITNEMVKGAPTFFQISGSLLNILDGADLAGYNSNQFDIAILIEEFLRVGIEFSLDGRYLVDACTIFKKNEERTLTAAMKFYCDAELEDAHNSLSDTKATARILRAQLVHYPELHDLNVPELHLYCQDNKRQSDLDFAGKLALDGSAQAIYTFGKAKGKTVKEDPGFGLWMLKQDFFTLETKRKLKQVFDQLDIKYPKV